MRFEDWPQRLDAVISAARNLTFSYGQFDCALFAADCAHAVTGIDYAAGLRGYDSKISAYRIISKYGSLEAMVTAQVGREPVHPANAHRGDMVLASVELAPGESGEAIGVCDGVRCWFPKDVGLRAFPRSAARLAWRIE